MTSVDAEWLLILQIKPLTSETGYRAIGLVLDFIHPLVCGRQKIPQRFGDWICLRRQVDGAG
jgi:hypothetical protein